MPSLSAIDKRSPKRQALSSALPMIAALDADIWTSIIEFLPVRADSAEEAAKEISTTLQTLLNLRLVSMELAELLHPTKSGALWQRLLLLAFDFSTNSPPWNIQNYQEYHIVRSPNAASGPANPQQLALEGRWNTMPDNMLDEDLVQWDKLGIYHRPSQYGFLAKLQQDPPTGLWPSTEVPFSLFHDLLQLLRFPGGDVMEAGGEGGDSLLKCLMAPAANSDPSSQFYRYHVMQTLGYAPHFWSRGHGIGKAWTGITDPNAFAAAIDPRLRLQREQEREQQLYGYTVVDDDISDDDEDSCDDDDLSEEPFEDHDTYSLPLCSHGNAKTLFQCISLSCCDWRSVCCNGGYDGETPAFFVGKSKASPHRWFGYCGSKSWS